MSGEKNFGCNAIIVSGICHTEHSFDTYNHLRFCATSLQGGKSLMTSYASLKEIRVFRSSIYDSIYRANVNANDCICAEGVKAKAKQCNVYRYDGLYKIVTAIEPPSKGGLYVFDLIKLQSSNIEQPVAGLCDDIVIDEDEVGDLSDDILVYEL